MGYSRCQREHHRSESAGAHRRDQICPHETAPIEEKDATKLCQVWFNLRWKGLAWTLDLGLWTLDFPRLCLNSPKLTNRSPSSQNGTHTGSSENCLSPTPRASR